MQRFFKTWPRYKYSFVSEDAQARHSRIVNTERPGIILHEVKQCLSEYYDVSTLECLPRSKYTPEMLIKPCRKFEKGGSMPALHWSDLRRAVRRVKKLVVRKQKVKPLSLTEVPFDPSKNSGLPFLTRKGDVAAETLERAKACERGACPPPMVMFSRGKNLDVARPVMAGPFEWQLIEGKFFYPLQKYLLSFNNPYLVGVPSCTVGAKVDEVSESPYVMCLDYSAFDGSISSLLINAAFGILRSCMQLTEEEQNLWERVVAYFITSPILCPDGFVYTDRRHGVPSGSMFTQMIDTLVNMIVINYVEARIGIGLERFYAVGDDSICGVSNPVSVSEVKLVASEIGISVNEEKSEILTSATERSRIHFLGHTYGKGLPERPIEETLNRLLTPESIDVRLFSKDSEVRKKYYLERIRAYQEDNASREAFLVLRKLEMRLQWTNASDGIIQLKATGWDRWWFTGTDNVERDKWDQNRRTYRRDSLKRCARAGVYWA